LSGLLPAVEWTQEARTKPQEQLALELMPSVEMQQMPAKLSRERGQLEGTTSSFALRNPIS